MTEDELHAAMWRYHDAVQRRDGIEQRLRNGETREDLYVASLSAAEAVVSTRVALFHLLLDAGWLPPPRVARDIAYDDALLHEAGEQPG